MLKRMIKKIIKKEFDDQLQDIGGRIIVEKEDFAYPLVLLVERLLEKKAQNLLDEKLNEIVAGVFESEAARNNPEWAHHLRTRLVSNIERACGEIINKKQHDWYKREELLDDLVQRLKRKQLGK